MALIPFDDRGSVIWMNGEMVEWRDARTHTLTHALRYGSQVFEGERAYGGVIFVVNIHSARKSCNYLDFDLPVPDDEMDAIKDRVLAADHIVDGYVRAFLLARVRDDGDFCQDTKIHLAVAALAMAVLFCPKSKMKGITLDISDWRRPSADSAPVHAARQRVYI